MTLIIIIMIRILDIIGVNVFCECGRALILLYFCRLFVFYDKMDSSGDDKSVTEHGFLLKDGVSVETLKNKRLQNMDFFELVVSRPKLRFFEVFIVFVSSFLRLSRNRLR